jgi:hypothetical protein
MADDGPSSSFLTLHHKLSLSLVHEEEEEKGRVRL